MYAILSTLSVEFLISLPSGNSIPYPFLLLFRFFRDASVGTKNRNSEEELSSTVAPADPTIRLREIREIRLVLLVDPDRECFTTKQENRTEMSAYRKSRRKVSATRRRLSRRFFEFFLRSQYRSDLSKRNNWTRRSRIRVELSKSNSPIAIPRTFVVIRFVVLVLQCDQRYSSSWAFRRKIANDR